MSELRTTLALRTFLQLFSIVALILLLACDDDSEVVSNIFVDDDVNDDVNDDAMNWPTVHVVLTTQQEVNEFGSKNISTIDGFLYIGPSDGIYIDNYENDVQIDEWSALDASSTDITDLNPLKHITRVGSERYEEGLVVINNDNLKTLDGLDNISMSGRFARLIVSGNDSILSLDALKNIEEPGFELSINSNLLLESIDSLDNITRPGGTSITENPNLLSLKGLEQLEEIRGALIISGEFDYFGFKNLYSIWGDLNISGTELKDLNDFNRVPQLRSLYINDNKSLRSLDALANCEIFRSIKISSNDSLENLMGLNLLGDGDIDIIENNRLTSLEGLHGVNSVGNRLMITGNKNLTSLVGLENLTYSELLIINDNEKLTSLDVLGTMTGIGWYLQISGNNALESLEGLQNFERNDCLGLSGSILLTDNEKLDDFCALQNFITMVVERLDFRCTLNYENSGNAFNPTTQEIINGKCQR